MRIPFIKGIPLYVKYKNFLNNLSFIILLVFNILGRKILRENL